MSYYKTQKDLAEYLNCDRETIRRRIGGFRKQIELGRYDPIVMSGRFIHIAAFMDYNANAEALSDPLLKDSVRPFNIEEAIKYFYEPTVQMVEGISTDEIVKKIGLALAR